MKREARITLARDPAELLRVTARAGRAPRLGLDVEANGLFAYQASLCVLTLAWEEDGQISVAVVDPLATPIDALYPLLGPSGPTKILHDLSFDARMLDETGAPLGRVRDTSVAARLLGFRATGLATLLASELGVTIDKRFQQHDWSRRPLTAEQIVYLAGDVLHLLPLDAHLARKAEALDIVPEIEEECRHRLASALAARHDDSAKPPAYARIKGGKALDAPGRAVLRSLTEARDRAAQADDVPPFKVVGNDVLLELARRRPTTLEALLSIRGAGAGRAASHAGALLGAIVQGLSDGDVPADDAPFFGRASLERNAPSRELFAARRAAEARINAFRRAEAKQRGVDEQVILPGHCAQDLAAILIAHVRADPALPGAIAGIPGLGARRFERYGEALAALAADVASAPP